MSDNKCTKYFQNNIKPFISPMKPKKLLIKTIFLKYKYTHKFDYI